MYLPCVISTVGDRPYPTVQREREGRAAEAAVLAGKVPVDFPSPEELPDLGAVGRGVAAAEREDKLYGAADEC